MFIAVDIGNTNVTIGIFNDGVISHFFKIETSLLRSKNRAISEIRKKICATIAHLKNVEAVYVSSVVPSVNKNTAFVLKKVFGQDPCVVGEHVMVPLINRYRIPSQVGQDRLVNAYAASKLYGPGLIIVDFGTAITFDILSKKYEYLGGLITPGLKMMQDGLNKKTALLPYVELARPIEIVGRDTVASIRAGLIYGTASLCDGIIEKLLKKECKAFRVVATGGDVSLVKSYSSHFTIIEDHLILKGLYLIFSSQKPRKQSF